MGLIMVVTPLAVLVVGIALALAYRWGWHCGEQAIRRSLSKVLALSLTEEDCTCGLWTKEKL